MFSLLGISYLLAQISSVILLLIFLYIFPSLEVEVDFLMWIPTGF